VPTQRASPWLTQLLLRTKVTTMRPRLLPEAPRSHMTVVSDETYGIMMLMKMLSLMEAAE
jgi:hypothetical protein